MPSQSPPPVIVNIKSDNGQFLHREIVAKWAHQKSHLSSEREIVTLFRSLGCI